MKIGYLRVSTEEQNTARQSDGLKTVCDEIYVEKISAVAKERPIFDLVMEKLEPGDTFVVWDLDRAFRSTIDAILEADKLRARSINFQICTLSIDTTEPAGEFFYTIMAAYGQFERRILSRRTREGMAAAKRRNKHVGRPRLLTDAQLKTAACWIESGQKQTGETATIFGVRSDTLRKALKRYRERSFTE